MANIRENKKNGKTVSYRFIVCLGKDTQGKQIRKYSTWTPPEGMTPSKARKAAERAADAWEDEIRTTSQIAPDIETPQILPPEKRHDDFVAFVNDTWMPLQVSGNNRKPKTISFYRSMTKIMNAYFKR